MKKKLKFPLIKGKSTWPTRPLCPICGIKKVWEPHSMAILAAGALLVDRKKKCGSASSKLDGFMSLTWHGAHDGGKGGNKEICCMVDVIQDVAGGQADLYFCSTRCLRLFFNECVDELERRMAEERKALQQNAPRYRRVAAPNRER